ncbi:hypothetical protein AAEU32_02945 [Pseudoalteromonas sp. SSDWG2]|uniref:hypothetical protein n=1 Tax=Pseudoalteromonas sp. SSDWG2 TaxID=3139391 RepID=UPI003BA969CE
MKPIPLIVLPLIMSASVFAANPASQIEHITVTNTDLENLSIQNYSPELIKLSIHGVNHTLVSFSGLSSKCDGYLELEIIFENIEHEYFVVPCNSRVVISENYRSEVGE